jgi:hypothetical protein
MPETIAVTTRGGSARWDGTCTVTAGVAGRAATGLSHSATGAHETASKTPKHKTTYRMPPHRTPTDLRQAAELSARSQNHGIAGKPPS